MKPETYAKICKDFDELGDVDFNEGKVMIVKDAIRLMRASVVYQMTEVEDEDDNGAWMLENYADAIKALSEKDPEAKVKIYWVEMGAFVIRDEGEED